ncbi:MAG TPA: 1-acyl-sn-glycerol-3-phosphate acyltransferase [Verrucomicrobiae bacterium]|jgi:1-acyl-sn-glycerol-3-phosphate acyltransferase
MKPDRYQQLYLWLATRRRTVVLTAIFIALACVAFSSRIALEEDILGILPENDRIVDDYKYALNKFGQIDRVYIDVSVNQDDPQKLAAAADEFYQTLATNRSFRRITYRIELGNQGRIINLLTSSLPDVFTEADATTLATDLDTNAIRTHLTLMRRKLSGPEGMVLKDVIAADPIGMSGLVWPKIMPLQTGFGGAHVDDGRLTSNDGQHVLMVAEPDFHSSDSKRSAVLVGEMLRAARAVETHVPGTRVAITGGHRMALDNATLLWHDSIRCLTIAVIAMFVLCFTAYRRRWLAAITFLPSLFGTLIAGAVVALVDRHVSGVAIGLASMALGITVDYGIYVVYHLDNAATDRASAGKIVGRLVLPTFVGALTIIAAFIVLSFSPMKGYQQLGLFGAVGVLMSAAFALLVLPLLVPLPKQKEVPPLRFTNWMENFHAWQIRQRPWLMLGVVGLSVVSLFGLGKIRFEGDIAKLNGITTATRSDDQWINRTWGEALGMTVVIARGTNEAEALAENGRAAQLLARQTNVAGIFSLAAVCPPPATQMENIRRWETFWTPERKASLQTTLQQVGGELGFRTNAFAPFWQTVNNPPEPLTLDRFRDTPLAQALKERVAAGSNDIAISTLVKLTDREQAGALRDALPGLLLIDQKNFAEHIASLARNNLGKFAFWTAIVVAAIAFFALAAVEVVIATLLPIAFGLLWTLGLMGLFGLPINVMNCVFVIFVIGMGEDYSVFLATSKLDVWRGHPPRIAPTSASVLISAATTIFGFAVLVFAQHPVLFSMGTTVLLGMASAFTATLIITPACMDLLLWRDPPRGAPRFWHPFSTLWVGAHLALGQFFLYCILRPWLKTFSPRRADDQLRRITRDLARGFIQSVPFGKLEYKNITPKTFSPPCIVISNHQSAVDVMLVVSLPADVRQTAKKRVFDAPFLGFGCKILGHVMVEPNRPEITLQRCRERLAAGASVHFYPEGTRSYDGCVQRFHRGAFELAIQLNQEILPLILCDTNTGMPRDGWWFESYHAVVRALPRVTPQNFDYSQGTTALMRHCETIVREALQRQLDELNTPAVLRRKVRRLYRYQGIYVEQFVHWKLKLDPIFPVLEKFAPRSGFILDLGCGYGLATHCLAYGAEQRTFLGVDYDENKIRTAGRTAPQNPRIQFQTGDILEFEYPACDAILLLDVLHYWAPAKQQQILDKARRALRPGGKLILRDGAKANDGAHRHIHRWEIFATKAGLNRTQEGLNFQTLAELEAALKCAGFTKCEIVPEAGRGSNVLLVASFD